MAKRYLLPKGSTAIVSYYRNIPLDFSDIAEYMARIGVKYSTEQDVILKLELNRIAVNNEVGFVWLDGLTYLANQHTNVDWVFGFKLSEIIPL